VSFAELEQVTVDLRGLREVDVDVGLGLGRVPGLAGDVRDVQLQVAVKDGVLEAPIAATIAGVRLEGWARADAREAPPSASLALGARDTALGGLAELLSGLRGLDGRLGRVDLRLGGRGETIGALVRALEVELAAGDARLSYGDTASGRAAAVTLADLVARIPPGETLRAEGRGALLGVPVTATAKAGKLANVLRDRRTPIALSVRGSGAALTLEGEIGEARSDSGSDLRFALDARRAGDLARWLGVSPQAAVPVAIAGSARLRRDEWHLDATTARLGRSMVTVDAHRRAIGTDKALVVASVRSPLIHVPELESLLPPNATRRDAAPAVADVPILPQGIDLADADIGLGLERVVLGRTDLVNAAFAARVREGRLPPTPFVATLAEVPFQGTIALDLRPAVPEIALVLGADAVDVGALLARLGIAEGLDAHAQAMRLELRGRGARLGEALRRSSFRARLEGGTLTLRDPARNPIARIALAEAVAGAEPDAPVSVSLAGRVDRTPVRIAIRSGTLAELLETARFVPFKIDAEAAGTQLNVNGRAVLPMRGEGDLTLVLSGERLDALSALARADLPPWGPWSIAGPLRVSRDGYEVPQLEVRVGETLLQGQGRVLVTGARPRIDVEVQAPRFQLDDFPTADWSALKGSRPRAEGGTMVAAARSQAKGAAQRGEALLSREVLSRFDAFVDVRVAEVRSGEDGLGGGWLRTQVEDGRLSLGPAQIDVPGGTATMSAAYTPLAQGVEVALGGYVERFDYAFLARRLKPGTDAAGELSLRLDLASRAPSLDAVMAHANGHIDFAVWPRSIAADVFDLWAVNVFVALLPAVDGTQGSRVNCVVGRFDLRDGKLTEDRLLLDTSRMRVTGTGKVDFETEAVELRMQPQAKRAQAFNLQTPVDVRGTLEDFRVGVRGEDVLASAVRFFGSALAVPFQRLTQGPVPVDGRDVCADPLREPTSVERR
jgi:uncharacterized protein involved in outer membrane biogenesis